MELRTTVVSTTVVSRPQPADVAGEDGEGYRSAERRKTDTKPRARRPVRRYLFYLFKTAPAPRINSVGETDVYSLKTR
jgi:hypothetical protein